MYGIIRYMENDGHLTQDIEPIIHIARALANDTNSDDSNMYSNSSE